MVPDHRIHLRRVQVVCRPLPGADMVGTPQAVRSYLKSASPRFFTVYESIARAVREMFPEAETSFQFRMPGWKIPRPRRVDPASVEGTLDPNWAQVYLVERKSGITLHLWNPVDFNGFRRRKEELERAGFKFMAGCIQFNRKSEYPVGLVVELLRDVKKSLEEDGRAVAPRVKGRGPAAPQGEDADHKELLRELDEWSSEPPMDGGD